MLGLFECVEQVPDLAPGDRPPRRRLQRRPKVTAPGVPMSTDGWRRVPWAISPRFHHRTSSITFHEPASPGPRLAGPRWAGFCAELNQAERRQQPTERHALAFPSLSHPFSGLDRSRRSTIWVTANRLSRCPLPAAPKRGGRPNRQCPRTSTFGTSFLTGVKFRDHLARPREGDLRRARRAGRRSKILLLQENRSTVRD